MVKATSVILGIDLRMTVTKYEIMLTTLCVSVTGVYIVKTTHSHKYKPSLSLEQGLNLDIAINMPKTTVGQTSKKEARHVEETHEIIFWCLHTSMILKT